MKRFALIFTLCLILLLASCASTQVQPNGVLNIRAAYSQDGTVSLSASEAELSAAGISIGDSVDIILNKKCTVTDVPYYSADHTNESQSFLTASINDGSLLLRLPAGNDPCAAAGFRKSRRASICLNEKGKYLQNEQARNYYYTQVPQEKNEEEETYSYSEIQDMHFVITEFTPTDGLLDAKGAVVSQPKGTHSQLIPIAAGKSCYVGFKDPEMSVVGAFYSNVGAWIAPLTAEQIQSYEYKPPNGIAGSWSYEDDNTNAGYRYLRLYTFSAPQNAAYVSLNLSAKPQYAYRQFIASMPVYALSNTGNLLWNDTEPAYQNTREKKLCVIGQSTVMLDRVLRNTNPGEECPDRFIVGFQEYLLPWFKSVDSYGFSGKGYMKNGETGVYDYIIDGNVDLSGYDLFLFEPGGNDLTLKNMGEFNDTDVSTYFGAMNALIDRILEQNGTENPPVIYISSFLLKRSPDADPSYADRTMQLNEKLEQFAEFRRCVFLDIANESGLDWKNINEWSYDGTHANQVGNRVIGLYYRQKLVGF